MKIGVIGWGYVGHIVTDFFMDQHEIYAFDPYYTGELNEKVLLYKSADLFRENIFDLLVVCVPTQPNDDGSCDTSLVEQACEDFDAPLILIRSTVPPGTVDRIAETLGKPQICFSPEYAGEGKYHSPYPFDRDEKQIPFYIFGGLKNYTAQIIDIYAPIAGPKKAYRQTSARIAETVKYMENTYFAWKVAFANEMRDITDVFDVNYWEVRDLWALDPRVDQMHTAVFPANRGFGGKCLPKDTLALLRAAEEYTDEFDDITPVLRQIIRTNMKRRDGLNEYPAGLHL